MDTTREYPIREGPRQRRVSLNRTKKPAESDMSRQCFGQTPTEERVGSRDSREKPETEKPGASGVRSNRSITALKNLQDISGKHDDCDALSLLIHCDDTGYGDLLEDAEKIKKAFEDFLDGARYEDLKSGRLGDADKTLKVGIVRDYVIPMAPFSQNARKRTVESHQRSGDWEKTLTSRTSDKGHWAHGAKSPELKDNESQEFNATDDKHNENGGINDDHKVDSGGDGEEEENDVELALNGFKGQEVNATDDKLNKSGEMNDDHKVDNGGDSKEREDDDVELALNGFEVYQRLNSPLDRPEVTEQDATVVRKRLAYIVQLRNYEFIALLTTTPDYAMPYLKALLYRYLAFQNGFGIHRAVSFPDNPQISTTAS